MSGDDRIARILEAIQRIDIVGHPVWEVVEALHRYPGLGAADGIYLQPEDVALTGNRFCAEGELALTWICECHDMPLPDVDCIIIEGRFQDGQPLIETVAIYVPIPNQP